MSYDFLLVDRHEHVLTVTLNRPEVMNALHPPLHKELDTVWDMFMADDTLWVAILTGAGERAFCAGSDLKYRTGEADEADLRHPAQPVESHLARCWKPVVAAVNGYAVGGGLELALQCDIIVAADHALFGLPEARRGLLADAGGTVKLPRRIPYHLAMGLLLTGKFIGADEAARYGLVNEVVPPAELMAAAQRWAAEVATCSPLAVQAAKQVAVTTLDLSVEQAMGMIESLATVRRLRESQDYIEGPRAFTEKRKPQWKGR
jgi:enoyl-CoA hydratase/carnithine racemase